MKFSEERIDPAMFAPCGMNCKVCYRHCSHKKPCAGCLNDDKQKPQHCRKCSIKDCASQKGQTYCFVCSEYPCKSIRSLEKNYRKRYRLSLMENSAYVKRFGPERFMEKQKEQYTCTQCGGIVSVHENECSECGKKQL